jgi:hypothetical protein
MEGGVAEGGLVPFGVLEPEMQIVLPGEGFKKSQSVARIAEEQGKRIQLLRSLTSSMIWFGIYSCPTAVRNRAKPAISAGS